MVGQDQPIRVVTGSQKQEPQQGRSGHVEAADPIRMEKLAYLGRLFGGGQRRDVDLGPRHVNVCVDHLHRSSTGIGRERRA